ncbi:F-box protein SKIP22 [Morus notabilis]|uniref:F-box protein SKIP22 n=1 Tax=Morus notabilis TaxID=981085 RepID=UPI000CED7F63|nr:F-box protein SKIP22 [Morus notabilis]
MKLRVRSFDSKEILRIDITNDSSLQQLKEAIAQAIPSSYPSSLRLSLNRTDELRSSSSDDSLLSLGIAAGDLIFYSVETLASQDRETLGDPPPPDSAQVINLDPRVDSELIVEDSGGKSMEIDGDCVDFVGVKFPETCFLRRVRRMVSEEFGEDGRNHKLMVIAVHSVFLESGFVEFDEFHFPNEWSPSMAFTMSFRYTLPEILGDQDCTLNLRESVVLKYQILGRFVNVLGALTSGGSVTYRVCLDEKKYAPAIGSLCAKGDEFEREVYGLWKVVRDGLGLPLLIDLCAKAGLPSPPCFMRLPSELQMKILEFLPGADIAKVGCVCKELQYLSCNNDLWRRKFVEEFEMGMVGSQAVSHWKTAFANSAYWQRKRKEEEAAAIGRRRLPHYGWPMFGPIRRDPNPLEVPWIIGGDYDRFVPPFGRPGRLPLFRRTFSPHCNLGGFSGSG